MHYRVLGTAMLAPFPRTCERHINHLSNKSTQYRALDIRKRCRSSGSPPGSRTHPASIHASEIHPREGDVLERPPIDRFVPIDLLCGLSSGEALTRTSALNLWHWTPSLQVSYWATRRTYPVINGSSSSSARWRSRPRTSWPCSRRPVTIRRRSPDGPRSPGHRTLAKEQPQRHARRLRRIRSRSLRHRHSRQQEGRVLGAV